MMILISGQPGNGKTLRAMALLLEEHERNKAANALPQTDKKWEPLREFFADIRGCKFPWVSKIPRNERGEPDYRLCPDGSFVVFDEAHSDGTTDELKEYGRLFPSTGKPGESDDARIRAMSTHRHRGFDLVFITQWPSKIHHQLRTLVGKHIHMNRSMGLNIAGTFTWQRVQADPYDEKEREKAEEEMWHFPKKLFDEYTSATLHTQTYKFKVPAKVWSALSTAVVVALIAWAAYRYSMPAKAAVPLQGADVVEEISSAGGARDAKPKAAPRAVSSLEEYVSDFVPRRPDAPWSAPLYDKREVVADPRAFCMHSAPGLNANGDHREESCTCFTEQGSRYLAPVKVCQDLARNGEPYNPFRRAEEPRGVAREAGRGEGGTPSDDALRSEPVGVGEPDLMQQGYGAMRPRS